MCIVFISLFVCALFTLAAWINFLFHWFLATIQKSNRPQFFFLVTFLNAIQMWVRNFIWNMIETFYRISNSILHARIIHRCVCSNKITENQIISIDFSFILHHEFFFNQQDSSVLNKHQTQTEVSLKNIFFPCEII